MVNDYDIKIYGISQEPNTKDYIIVFQDGYCQKCGKKWGKYTHNWCKTCQINYLKKSFTGTNENEEINNLIKEMQLKIDDPNDVVFEWIQYDQFSDFEEIDDELWLSADKPDI